MLCPPHLTRPLTRPHTLSLPHGPVCLPTCPTSPSFHSYLTPVHPDCSPTTHLSPCQPHPTPYSTNFPSVSLSILCAPAHTSACPHTSSTRYRRSRPYRMPQTLQSFPQTRTSPHGPPDPRPARGHAGLPPPARTPASGTGVAAWASAKKGINLKTSGSWRGPLQGPGLAPHCLPRLHSPSQVSACNGVKTLLWVLLGPLLILLSMMALWASGSTL